MIDSINETHKKILNERLSTYGIDAITDEEAIHILTGISITKIRTNLEKHGLLKMVKFADSFLMGRFNCTIFHNVLQIYRLSKLNGATR